MIRNFLLGFAGIALLVGAFVIFNTLSITVAQRTREFATLRTLGASRKQVLRSVVLEGLVIGLVASVIGLVLGLGLAKGMVALFSALGVDLPDASTVVATQTIIVSLMLGTGITLLASILPARRATRVPPIAAVREGATLPATRMAGAFAQRRPRRHAGLARRDLARHLRRRRERGRGRVAARRRRARAVRRHRAAGAAARQAAGPRRRLAGAPRRWRRRGAGGRKRRPQPRPDRVDRRRADDRAHARHRRRGARRRLQRHDPPGRVGSGPRRPRDRRRRGPGIPGLRGRRAGERAGRDERLARAVGHRARAGRGRADQRHRSGHDRGLLQVRLVGGLRATRSASSGPTAPS